VFDESLIYRTKLPHLYSIYHDMNVSNTTQDQPLIAVCGNIRAGIAIRVLNQIYGVTDTVSLI